MKSVKLYGYANSPFVRKTACFLYYKEIEFEHIPVNPIEPHTTIGFTNKTRVPVLKIGEDWKLESSEHAFWLDEVFPEKPLCPRTGESRIREIDNWISNTYLTSLFRLAIDGEINLDFRRIAWRLAALISAHTPLPEKIRNKWPDILQHAPFIQDMACHMNLDESYKDMQSKIILELANHIGEGPYIGGFETPTMLDLAVYPNIIWNYTFGLDDQLSVAKNPIIMSWLQRISKHLPANPCLTPDNMMINNPESFIA